MLILENIQSLGKTKLENDQSSYRNETFSKLEIFLSFFLNFLVCLADFYSKKNSVKYFVVVE